MEAHMEAYMERFMEGKAAFYTESQINTFQAVDTVLEKIYYV